ncbi:MAG: Mrp/NBP35 family ATP-binding protein [Gemmatimonadetes bacterium]|nr:Mrp/NBP35 family ATP-binding protein [Gemmatimonadota bacterium]
MDVQSIRDRVESTLRRVKPAGGDMDVVGLGLVGDLQVDEGGAVSLLLGLRPSDDPSLAETVRLVLSGVKGVTGVDVRTAESKAPPEGTVPAAPKPREPGKAKRSLPVVGPKGPASAGAPRSAGQVSQEEASRHPSEAEPLAGVRHVVAVSSGKGGVGKSTVSTNLAAAWAKKGYRVGLLDADIYGPDIPTMFGATERPRIQDDMVVPVEAHGVKLMSLGFLVDDETPAIWRGPIIMGIVRQFLHQVVWGELDYLVVDLPPGTGDAQLSLVQLVKVDGAVMVSTPQDVSVTGVLKGIKMFESVDVPVLGIVENMRGFVCPDCGSTHDLFGSGGGEGLAGSLGLPFIGAVPLGLAVRQEGDKGTPTVIGRPDSPEGQALEAIADVVEARIVAAAGSAEVP